MTQHNKSRCWWRTAGQMHFTIRSAPTVQPTIVPLPVTLPDPSSYSSADSRLTTCSWTRAGRPPGASGELISVISRSCNLSRLLHGQLIIIAIPISGPRFGARASVRIGSCAEVHRLTPAEKDHPMFLLVADETSGVATSPPPFSTARDRSFHLGIRSDAFTVGQLLLLLLLRIIPHVT